MTGVVVTGGPGSGKTCLIGALAARGHAVAPEAGRADIRRQQAVDGQGLP
ncbi:AAA family ATPase [Brevundimonas sp. UBA7534]|nr:AAA family ATPase [Brevundimonas sp. UBA7534]